ncbi:tripartite motif-containing protein 2-like [Dysidea avara]|uniref:tripartite motif-containing protein 2-like n=1 Tax=Dysidea avara TaxID=196820 RepID=UPI003324DA2D
MIYGFCTLFRINFSFASVLPQKSYPKQLSHHLSIHNIFTMAAMDVKKATDSLTCPVCYQIFKNPKYLPCHHSYCEKCLEKMQVQSKIICPECRREATVPAGGVKDFDNNFLINRLVDELILKHKVEGETEVKCDECMEEDPVETFCPDCTMFLCHVCNECHKRSNRYQGHAIVPLVDLRSKKEDISVQPKPKVMLCKEHDNELKYYCETCEELVCLYCTVKEHNRHNHDTVKKMANKQRSELKDITGPVEGIIKDLSEAHDKITDMGDKIRQQAGEVDKKIDEHYDKLFEKLKKQKEEVKQRLGEIVQQKEKKMAAQLEEVESTQAQARSMKEVDDAVKESSDEEALSAKKQVINQMKELTEKYKRLDTTPVESNNIKFYSSKVQLPQFSQLIDGDLSNSEILYSSGFPREGGQPQFKIITKDIKGHSCSLGGSHVSVQVKWSTGEVTTAQVRDNDDGSYTTSFVAKQAGEVELLVSIEGEQIKASPYTVVIHKPYTAIDQPSKVISNNGQMGKPWGIAFGRDGMWAVADWNKHCIYVFDSEDQLIRQFGCKGSNPGQISGPRGVAFDGDNYLYVADSGNHRIQKFDINGNYLLQFGVKGKSDGQFDAVYGITVYHDRVYVADYGNQCIPVFKTNGELCLTIGSGQVDGPYDVAISSSNHLLVVDYIHSCVYTFTLDGGYVGKFGTKGTARGELYHPYGLTVDINGFTLVADSDNHRVSIFDQNGTSIHCFGSEGKQEGQFIHPFGIAISPNGSIYICDYNNFRIQIF